MTVVIGVLALQGSFKEHIAMLAKCGCECREIRTRADLLALDLAGIIIPGGESSVISGLLEKFDMMRTLRDRIHGEERLPVWGTCAGMILMCDRIEGQCSGGQSSVGGLDCTVHRNYFGSQYESTTISVDNPLGPDCAPVDVHLIRAPIIKKSEIRIPESQYTVLVERDDNVYCMTHRNILVSAFHPELNIHDLSWHSYFVGGVQSHPK